MMIDHFMMQLALGRPEKCSEEVTRAGHLEPCDETGVALRIDPEEGDPYPVCARHARAEMVPLETIVRFLLDRERAQQMIARGLVAMAARERQESPDTKSVDAEGPE